MTEGITCGEKKEPPVEDSTKQIVQKAAQAVGSLKEDEAKRIVESMTEGITCGEKKESEMEEDEAKRIVESMTDGITCGEKKEPQVEDSTKQIVQKAAQAVGSLKETEFDIRFNPDVFSPGVV